MCVFSVIVQNKLKLKYVKLVRAECRTKNEYSSSMIFGGRRFVLIKFVCLFCSFIYWDYY